MTPNIAFDLLTNEFDLVGYQKLLRVVGMGNAWKGGNNALAAKLNMSYGRVIKLRKVLEDVGFISVQKGDNAHGEADTWQVIDIWQMNAEATLSPNEQGQEQENADNLLSAEIISVEPYHETNNPLSPNKQATLSPNEQHKEKIFSKEDIQDLLDERDLAPGGVESFAETSRFVNESFRKEIDETLYWILTEKEIARCNFPVEEWLTLLMNLEAEGFGRGESFKDFYRWVSNQDWVETVSPKLLKGQIEKYKKRDVIEAKKVIKNGTNPSKNGKGNGNGSGYNSEDSSQTLANIRRRLNKPDVRL